MEQGLTHKQRTRARILDEASKALREHGHEGIGVASLMKRAGLTHGGFYAHFKDRDDLVAAAIERMFEDSRRMVIKYLEGKPAREGLAALIDHYLSPAHLRQVERGCPIAALSSEAARLPKAARVRFREGAAVFEHAIAKALVELGRDGADGLARSVLAEMVGALALARAEEGEAGVRILESSRAQLKSRLKL